MSYSTFALIISWKISVAKELDCINLQTLKGTLDDIRYTQPYCSSD